MAYWLLVERRENWEVDREEGFLRFGIPKSKVKQASRIEKGDILIFYVSSGVSRFSDVREATDNGTKKLALGGNYDAAFPVYISTRPYLTLPKEAWVPLAPVARKLSFIGDVKDWRQLLRTTLRLLSDNDGRFLLSTMQTANQPVGG